MYHLFLQFCILARLLLSYLPNFTAQVTGLANGGKPEVGIRPKKNT